MSCVEGENLETNTTHTYPKLSLSFPFELWQVDLKTQNRPLLLKMIILCSREITEANQIQLEMSQLDVWTDFSSIQQTKLI